MPCETALSAETILHECPRLGPDDCFTFRCGPDLDCFGHCCQDVTIVLTPYDVLRLKRALGVDSSEFLEEHTLAPRLPGQKFPIVILKMDEETKKCPFLGAAGCGVYADRPWACRMYPLGTAEPKAPTPDDRAFHFVIHEDLCHGHGQDVPVSVREWTVRQGAEEFEMMNAGFKDLTLHDFWEGKHNLTDKQADMFYMACYDLDRFRRFVFETRFLQLFDVDEARVEALRSDDQELLEFAMQWLRFSLFGERSMRLRRNGK
ncbi:MAG TPA: YkgJ family cysteine cluster protein [Bryobacteraceae bacterium]|nr:YkgJ family cysteine cluster protein [Bryobacteraceae bacterium]